MLMQVKVKNFLSFRDEVTVGFDAGRETRFAQYLPVLKKFRNRKVLPISCLFGANGAGKTNFMKLFVFIQKMVLQYDESTLAIPVSPYLLDEVHKTQPSEIEISFLTEKDNICTFSLAVTPTAILKESLFIRNSQGEKRIYQRAGGRFLFDVSTSERKEIVLKAMASATPEKQLFLHRSRKAIFEQNCPILAEALQWFESLVLVTPETTFVPFWGGIDKLQELFSELNFGIDGIALEKYPEANIPDTLKESAIKNIRPDLYLGAVINRDFIIADQVDGKVRFQRVCSLHKISESQKVAFGFCNESDGTRRILELSPVIYSLLHATDKRCVFIVDELDRSLHTLLTKYIIKKFIQKSGPDSRVQVLFTCHDGLMIDSDVFRRDEIRIVSNEGETTQIKSVYETTKTRTDSSIRKLYLQGKLGGIPKVDDVRL